MKSIISSLYSVGNDTLNNFFISSDYRFDTGHCIGQYKLVNL